MSRGALKGGPPALLSPANQSTLLAICLIVGVVAAILFYMETVVEGSPPVVATTAVAAEVAAPAGKYLDEVSYVEEVSIPAPPEVSEKPKAKLPSRGGRKQPYSLYYGDTRAEPCQGSLMGILGDFDILEVPQGEHLTLVFESDDQAEAFNPNGYDEATNCFYFSVEEEDSPSYRKIGITYGSTSREQFVQKIDASGNEVSISCPGASGWVLFKSPFPGGKTPNGQPCSQFFALNFK